MIFFSKPPFLMKKNKKKIMEQTFLIYLLPFLSNSLLKIEIFARGGNILEVIYIATYKKKLKTSIVNNSKTVKDRSKIFAPLFFSNFSS